MSLLKVGMSIVAADMIMTPNCVKINNLNIIKNSTAKPTDPNH